MDAALTYKPRRTPYAARTPHALAERRERPGEAGSGAGMPQYLQRASGPRAAVPVQRDGPGTTLPPVPNYQLRPPSLLQQPQPPSLLPAPQFQLQLYPQLEEWLLQTITPETLAAGLAQLNLGSINPVTGAATPGQGSATPAGATPASAPATGPGAAGAGFNPTPPLLTTTPPSPGIGVWLGMAMTHPGVNRTILGLRDRALRDFNSLGTGTQIALISSQIAVAGGAFSVLMTDPRYRAGALSLINGRVIGIPFTPVSLELNVQQDNILFGFHLDLGAVLPARFGFGAASPVGPYPMQLPQPPLQRAADGAAAAAPADLGQRIQAATGGQPLDAGTQRHLERSLGVALPDVQLHTDAEADRLAQSVGARAFTSGTHVFFRADAHPDAASDGLQLLAHEALHTAQQTRGPVAGTPAPGGVALSEPGDRFEREASQTAERAVPARPAAPG